MLPGPSLIRTMLVALTVILALVLTVTLRLVLVRVGVLPMLLLITVIPPPLDPSVVTRPDPLVGSILVNIRLSFNRLFMHRVVWSPLLASTTVLTFRLPRVVMILRDDEWTTLVPVTTFRRSFLPRMKIMAPFRRVKSVNALPLHVTLCLLTALGSMIVIRTLLIAIRRFRLARPRQLAVGKRAMFLVLFPWMTFPVTGRLDRSLVEQVNASNLPLEILVVGRTLAMLKPFLARALAPLKMT